MDLYAKKDNAAQDQIDDLQLSCSLYLSIVLKCGGAQQIMIYKFSKKLQKMCACHILGAGRH